MCAYVCIFLRECFCSGACVYMCACLCRSQYSDDIKASAREIIIKKKIELYYY